ENTPVSASSAKVTSTPPAPATTADHGKSAGSQDPAPRSQANAARDPAAPAGSACDDAAPESVPTSVACRSIVGGRRRPAGPAGPPGGSLELVMSCPCDSYQRLPSYYQIGASGPGIDSAYTLTKSIKAASFGRPATSILPAPAAVSGAATC